MTVEFQASLFDGVTETASGAPTLGALDATVRRTSLSDGAWVDVRPGWVSGADDLFVRLVHDVPWYAERRQMYDRVVDVPRLLKFYGSADPLPDPLLADARDGLSAHYTAELPEGFATAGMCYYRDGRDSVAWHGDRFDAGVPATEAPPQLLIEENRWSAARYGLDGEMERTADRVYLLTPTQRA